MAILRQLTGGFVAFSVWELPDLSIATVKNTQAEYDDFAVVRKGVGEIAGRPNRDARFLMAVGGVPALDTVDGWPAVGDCWEWFDTEKQRTVLVVANGELPGFQYKSVVASEPVNNRSTVTGITVSNIDARETFLTYDKQRLSQISTTKTTSLTRSEVNTEIDNHRSVTFDATSSGQADTGSSITFAHTVANQSDRYISVSTSCRTGQTVDDVDYNAINLAIDQNVAPTNTRGTYWHLVAPATGVNNVVVTFSATTSGVAGAWSAYGVHQTVPHTDEQSAGGDTDAGGGNQPSVTVSSAAGELITVGLAWSDTGTLTQDTDATEDWNLNNTDAGGNLRNGGGCHIAGAASVTIDHTIPASRTWVIVGVAVASAATANPKGPLGMPFHGPFGGPV